jgi:hypothetical protein
MMSGALTGPEHHLMGEQPGGEASASPEVAVQTYAGTVHVEWDGGAPVTPLGQLPFFIGYLKEGGLFDGWVADCPLHLVSPNAPSKRDVLGTLLLSVLAGHWRYAHITTVRGDKVNPPLLGLRKVVCEDSVRRSLAKIEAGAGVAWLRQHLDYVTGPLLSEPWILDVDTSVVPLYGRQEGAVVGYNPIKRGRPSHVLHTYMMANLRLVLEVETAPGNRHTSKHAAPGLWDLMERLGPSRRPALLRGDADWGKEAVMHRAEQEALPYLFKLQMTKGVKQVLERAMSERDWVEAGHGWYGKEATLRLEGWSRPRRVVLLRRALKGGLAMLEREPSGQLMLGLAEIDRQQAVYEYAVLVTSLAAELATVTQLYRDRGDVENTFDELKNQWGWGGFTTHDLKRCRLMARIVALIFNWWSLFARLAEPDHHREAITSRPLLLHAIARQTRHAGQTTLIISSMHGLADQARRALQRIAAFFTELRSTAEQLTPLEKWYRILSRALIKYLRGRVLKPPARLKPA